MNFVRTIPGKCKKCYSCIRHCPVKAICVENDQSFVLEERCINCGNCLSYCSQNAKIVDSFLGQVKNWISQGEKVIAILAPSYLALPDAEVIPDILLRSGFSKINDASFGAEMIAERIAEEIEKANILPKISSPCPAVVQIIRRHFPQLIPHLITIVSPLMALARLVKKENPESKVVFFGPCIAKMTEVWEEDSCIDAVCTFDEMLSFSADKNPKSDCCSGSIEYQGAGTTIFPLSGGLLENCFQGKGILERKILIVEGAEDTIGILHAIEKGEIRANFIDILFCRGGCLNGPAFPGTENVFLKREKILKFHEELDKTSLKEVRRFAEKKAEEISLTRTITEVPHPWNEPEEEQIRSILNEIGIHHKEEELNCGACGYQTCRENATAIFNSIAEKGMCLHYVLRQLQNLNQELIQSERMSALGQLASGIAHEINNPLGLISAYAQYLQKGNLDKSQNNYLTIIQDEINRITDLIRNFLNLSRKNTEKFHQINLGKILRNLLIVIEPTLKDNNIQLKTYIEDKPLMISGDENLISQIVTNLILNSQQAIESNGTITIRIKEKENSIFLEISDDGCGIPQEIQGRIFEPFYTTKEIGKGTGLGLFIVYEAVKRHNGTIKLKSDTEKGTSFRILFPMERTKGKL